MSETWKPVTNHPSYQVSNAGRIKRISKSNPEGRVLRSTPGPNGYRRVTLCARSQRKTAFLHLLVLAEFNPAPTAGLKAWPLDGDKSNSDPSNWEWITTQELFSRVPRGRRGMGPTSLRPTEVKAIKALRGIMTQMDIADAFGIHQVTVSHVQTGRIHGGEETA